MLSLYLAREMLKMLAFILVWTSVTIYNMTNSYLREELLVYVPTRLLKMWFLELVHA